jgi:hypothetical protein
VQGAVEPYSAGRSAPVQGSRRWPNSRRVQWATEMQPDRKPSVFLSFAGADTKWVARFAKLAEFDKVWAQSMSITMWPSQSWPAVSITA